MVLVFIPDEVKQRSGGKRPAGDFDPVDFGKSWMPDQVRHDELNMYFIV